MSDPKKCKIILSGGGTGGHIYPAVAVAEALHRKLGNRVELLFVGAEGKMEMEKLPALGYRIVGLPVAGLQRRLSAKNLLLPFKVMKSVRMARQTIRTFGADVVAGFGGYASGPVLWMAQRMGIPTLIQEQNSFAGMTNRLLGKRAKRICTAYDGMERFFPSDRIMQTGNPLREVGKGAGKRDEALAFFGFSPDKPVLLILGGSLGTRTLNEMMKRWVDELTAEGRVQVIWQTGKFYDAEMARFMEGRSSDGIWRGAFIERMDLAYAAADGVMSRAGAGTVSELCVAGKPVIFVPSPNVAEDHQTKNALALVAGDAAGLISDAEAVERGIPAALALLEDALRRERWSKNIKALARPDAADQIAGEILRLAGMSE